MEFFKGMTYDEIRPIFEREYNKIQTLFKQEKDVQKTKKKRVADETLLQESFKKSSPSLDILSDIEAEVMAIHVVLPKIGPDVVASAVVALPTTTLDPAIESDLEVEPFEAPPYLDYVLSSPIHIPASPDYHPESDTKSSHSRMSLSLLRTNLRQLSLYRLRRHLVSSYSTLSASVGLSRKRCRSPTTSRPISSMTPTILSYVHADHLPPRKRLRGSPAISYMDVTIEATIEPISQPVHHGLAVEDRLDEHNEVIGEMYEHQLEIPLLRIEEIEEELMTLRARVSDIREGKYVVAHQGWVAELSDDSTRVVLKTTRGGLAKMRHLVSSYSTLSASVGLSRKRCRSPTTSRPTSSMTPAILSYVHADHLPPRKRLRGSPAISYMDVTIEDTIEPISQPVHHGLAVEDRLDEHNEVIGEMYEHLLEIPLLRIEETEEELMTLRARHPSGVEDYEGWTCKDVRSREGHCRAVAAVSDCLDTR
nr:hypothetical protein [Tanacetum cinerariifolium]